MPQRIEDLLQHGLLMAQNLVIPESQDAEALGPKPSRSRIIICLRARVLSAIDLDDQALRETGEIDDVAPNRGLAAKAKAFELISPQEIPEPSFSIRQLLAKIARRLNRHGVDVHC